MCVFAYCHILHVCVCILQAFDTLRTLFVDAISNYFDDVNLRNLIDFIQADVSSFLPAIAKGICAHRSGCMKTKLLQLDLGP